MHLIIKRVKTNTSITTLILDTKSGIRKILLFNIVCIRYKDNYLVFYLEDNNTFLAEGSFSSTIEILPNYFILINKDTIINTLFLKKVEPFKFRVTLQNGNCYPVSALKVATLCRMFGLKLTVIPDKNGQARFN